ncbi:MAG: hypothetical protein K8S27_05135 [Candidatus Omnitrophica bacterium]|nr:hypothetical protein [Candidatus Omnitrophota bacterium]
MLYLFLGESPQEKDKRMGAIKREVLLTRDAEKLDYAMLDARRCSPEDLKKSLLALPAVSERRLLVIRQIHKLSQQNKNILVEFVASKPGHIVIVLETTQSSLPKKLAADLNPLARVESFRSGYKITPFDLTKLMAARKPREALKLLSQLLDEGQQPVQITGALVWYWGNKMSGRVTPEAFQSGLRALQQADLNIKRTRLLPRQAVEVLVVELMQLMVSNTNSIK